MDYDPDAIPKSIETEIAVIGCCIKNYNDAVKAIQELNPDDFYAERNQVIFSAISDIVKSGKKMDAYVINEEIVKRNSDISFSELIELEERVVSTALIDEDIKIVKEKSRLRKLHLIYRNSIADIESGKLNSDELRNSILEQISSVESNSNKDIYYRNFYEHRRQVMISRKKENKEGGLIYPKTQYPILNSMLIQGFAPGLVIIAGRPSMGKTDLKLNFIDHWLKSDIGVYDWSPEMMFEGELDRLDSIGVSVPVEQLYSSEVERKDDLKKRWQFYDERNYWFDATPMENFSNLFLKIKMEKMNNPNLKIACIDTFGHLNDVRSGKSISNRQAVLASLVSLIFNRGKELGVCFVILHHLSRGLESRGNKTPRMSDLFETSAFENCADLILFLHRPAIYDKTSFDETTHCIIGKQRNAGRFMNKGVKLEMVGDHKFEEKGDLEEDEMLDF